MYGMEVMQTHSEGPEQGPRPGRQEDEGNILDTPAGGPEVNPPEHYEVNSETGTREVDPDVDTAPDTETDQQATAPKE